MYFIQLPACSEPSDPNKIKRPGYAGSCKSVKRNLDSQQNFSFKNQLTAEITGNFESSSAYGIFVFEPYYVVDLAIGKALFNNKAILKLSLSDILNTNGYRFSTRYNNLDYYSKEKAETRVALLSFNYKFEKKTVNPTRKRVTGLEDERSRIRN